MASDERVLLNVGGSKFEVLRRTLGRFPDSLLGQLANPGDEVTLLPSPNGEYFFDRNGRFFEFIIEYYRSGTIAPPSDLTRQQVVAELQFWGLDAEPYLSTADEEKRIRNYVEAPVEVPLEQLDSDDLLDRLTELPLAERLRYNIELVRHSDTDLVQVAVTDLCTLDAQFKQDPNLLNSPAHLEVSYFIALGYYRLGHIRSAREYVAAILKVDPEYNQAKDLQILLQDTSVNYSRLGLLALGVTLFGALAFRFWAAAPKASKK